MYAVLNSLIFIKNKCAYSCFWQACICIFLVKFDNKTLKYCSKLLWASFSLKMNDSITSKWTKTVGELALSVEKNTIKTCFFTCAESQYRQIKVKLGCLSCIYVFHCYMHAYWRNHSDLIRSLWSIVFEKKIVW